MSNFKVSEFEKNCLSLLGNVLQDFGYSHRKTYVRPSGVAVEFVNGSIYLYVIVESNTIVLDMIVMVNADEYFRVSLNQIFWSMGFKNLVDNISIQEKLKALSVLFREHFSNVLSGNLSNIDKRYCFKMSKSECERYIYMQTGQRGTPL